MDDLGERRDFTTNLTGRFVDDDDIVRTGRAMIEVDGHGFMHIPVNREWNKEFRRNADWAKKAADSATSSAASAKSDADRASKIAESTSWDNDRLVVNGKKSPPLTGPKGDTGDVNSHTHKIGDVDGLQQRLDSPVRAFTVFRGEYQLKSNSDDVLLPTPLMRGTITFANVFSLPDGGYGGLLMPRIFDKDGKRYRGDANGTWTATTAKGGGAYRYFSSNLPDLVLPDGYVMDGIEVNFWSKGAIIREIIVTGEVVAGGRSSAEFIQDQVVNLGEGVDLDTLEKTGTYHQQLTKNASTELNYPYRVAGLLEVINPPSGSMVYQRYTSFGVYSDMYIRGKYQGHWGSWWKLSSSVVTRIMPEDSEGRIPLGVTDAGGGVVLRDEWGRVYGPMPTTPSEFATKEYVDVCARVGWLRAEYTHTTLREFDAGLGKETTAMSDLKAQVRGLNEDEWAEFLGWVVMEEKDRRDNEHLFSREQAHLVKYLQDRGQLARPQVAESSDVGTSALIPGWVDPAGDPAQMYQYGDVVVFEGRVMRSCYAGLNRWEPGTLGADGRVWEDITPASSVEESGALGPEKDEAQEPEVE